MRARRRLFIEALLLFALITLPVLGGRQQKPPPPDPELHPAGPFAKATPRQTRYARAGVKDQGDFMLSYEPRPTLPGGVAGRRVGISRQEIECVLDSLNERMALPFNIVVAFKTCEEPEAFYDEDTHEVTLCHGVIDRYFALFSEKLKDEAKLEGAVRGATAFTLFHEIGHALINVWNLPITGREEDAADQLSVLILIEEIADGEQMAFDVALSFKLYADWAKGEEKIYWDEHSLDEQRFYDTLCMLYGHDPETYAHLIRDGSLPRERAGLCKEDYTRFKNSWQTLLAPYVKNPPDAVSKIRMR